MCGHVTMDNTDNINYTNVLTYDFFGYFIAIGTCRRPVTCLQCTFYLMALYKAALVHGFHAYDAGLIQH